MAKNVTREELIEAGNKWLHMQFITGRQQFKEIFTELSPNAYITLNTLARMGIHDDKLYLRELSEKLDIPMSTVSGRVKKLQELGLVYWNHDKSGTYITLSELGHSSMEVQEKKIIEFMEKTISIYGYEKFITLIDYRQEFNNTIDQVIESYK